MTVNCSDCGKKLKVSPEHAGKKVKCPACECVFVVDSPETQAAAPSACPECGADMAPGAVICVSCGLNPKTGKHIGGIGRQVAIAEGTASVKPPLISESDEEPLTFTNAFVRSFTFPLRGQGIGMIIVMPILSFFGGFFFFAGIIYIGMYYGCLIDVMRSAAGGLKFKPEIQWDAFTSEVVEPGLKLLFVIIIVALLPVSVVAIVLGTSAAVLGDAGALFGSFAGIILFLTVAFIAAYLPISVTISGIYNAFVSAINPAVVIRSILKIPGEYFLVALFVYAMAGVSFLLQVLLALMGPAVFLAPAVTFYMLAVAVTRLGFMAHMNREKLGW